MFGKNPIRAPEASDGQVLHIVNLFPTLQGEGPFAGYPSVFIRLGGCNLACRFCDTEFEQFTAVGVDEIINQTVSLATGSPSPLRGGMGRGASSGTPMMNPAARPPIQPSPARGEGFLATPRVRNLVVITGGEPFRQNIVPLCEALLSHGFQVQIETNGTLWRDVPAQVNIVCSPKTSNGQYHPVRADLLKRTSALKFIISAHQTDYADVGEVGQAEFNTPIYVQPMDEYDPIKNAANLARAGQLAQTHGYRLSLQLHKILGIE